GLAAGQGVGELDREVVGPTVDVGAGGGRRRRRGLGGGLAVDEQLNRVARRGGADEHRRAVVGDVVPHDARVVGRAEAEVVHRKRRDVVDLELNGVAVGRTDVIWVVNP